MGAGRITAETKQAASAQLKAESTSPSALQQEKCGVSPMVGSTFISATREGTVVLILAPPVALREPRNNSMPLPSGDSQ